MEIVNQEKDFYNVLHNKSEIEKIKAQISRIEKDNLDIEKDTQSIIDENMDLSQYANRCDFISSLSFSRSYAACSKGNELVATDNAIIFRCLLNSSSILSNLLARYSCFEQ